LKRSSYKYNCLNIKS
jgi:hypothetical protein